MKEHPILFSAPMVRAILSGTKTQTRRVVRLSAFSNPGDQSLSPCYKHWRTGHYEGHDGAFFVADNGADVFVSCPFGVPGDRLWVREAWLPDPPINGSWTGAIEWNGTGRPIAGVPERYRSPEHCLFSAEWIDGSVLHWRPSIFMPRPSIFMPRWASRITLEVTGVRVERLQDLKNADARAEGWPPCDFMSTPREGPGPAEWFCYAWDTINGRRAPWASNPWVWVVSFRRVQP